MHSDRLVSGSDSHWCFISSEYVQPMEEEGSSDSHVVEEEEEGSSDSHVVEEEKEVSNSDSEDSVRSVQLNARLLLVS